MQTCAQGLHTRAEGADQRELAGEPRAWGLQTSALGANPLVGSLLTCVVVLKQIQVRRTWSLAKSKTPVELASSHGRIIIIIIIYFYYYYLLLSLVN